MHHPVSSGRNVLTVFLQALLATYVKGREEQLQPYRTAAKPGQNVISKNEFQDRLTQGRLPKKGGGNSKVTSKRHGQGSSNQQALSLNFRMGSNVYSGRWNSLFIYQGDICLPERWLHSIGKSAGNTNGFSRTKQSIGNACLSG